MLPLQRAQAQSLVWEVRSSMLHNTDKGIFLILKNKKVRNKKDPELYPPAAAAAASLQSCPTLSDPMDCSPPGSSIHGIFQGRVLEWGATAFSKSHTLVMLKILQDRLQQYMNCELPDVQAGFRKAEEPETKLPKSVGSLKKQESSRKTSTSASLTMPKPLTVWITTNCRKF